MPHLVQTALGLRIEGLHKAKALQGGCLDLCCARIKTPDTCVNNDFTRMLFVNPAALCFVVILCQLCRNSLPPCLRDRGEFPRSAKNLSFTVCRNTLPKVQIATYA